jgi:hypothetical protein
MELDYVAWSDNSWRIRNGVCEVVWYDGDYILCYDRDNIWMDCCAGGMMNPSDELKRPIFKQRMQKCPFCGSSELRPFIGQFCIYDVDKQQVVREDEVGMYVFCYVCLEEIREEDLGGVE